MSIKKDFTIKNFIIFSVHLYMKFCAIQKEFHFKVHLQVDVTMSKIYYTYLLCLAVIVFGFNPTYSVGEDVGDVSVAVSLLSGILARDVNVSLWTTNGMAVGESLNKPACLITGYVAQF